MRARQDAILSEHSTAVCRMALPCDRDHLVSLSNSADMDTSLSTTTLPDLKDVLERDQRTVITPSRQPRRTTLFSMFYYSLTTSNNKIQRFGEVLTLCACLLGCVPAVFSLPTSMSAPVKPDLLKEKPMWINPCTSGGVATQINETDGSDMEHIPPNSVIFNRIVAIAKNARNEFDPLFNSFIQTYFKSEDNVRSLQIKPSYMPWLPLFAKDETKVKEEIAAAISGSDYRTALQNSYEWLQRVAVGLEQLYLDQYNSNAEFHKEFESALQAMKLVFCEIETAMLEFDVPKRKDIQRDVMTDDERNISGDPRNLRDWIILLTYTNMLDYVITVFDHFEHNSS